MTTGRKRVARVLTIGATAGLAIVLGTAQAASAGTTSIYAYTTGSNAYATVYGTSSVTVSVAACDTKADGHHAEGWLVVGNRAGATVKTVKAKAYGGNGTCVTAKATVACADAHVLTLWSNTMEGNAVVGSPGGDQKIFAGC